MADGQLGGVLRHIQRRIGLQRVAGLSDGDLLAQFAERREEAAFEALLRRHGRMVLGVCRRVLRNEHDAEDAFQATFLVLAQKAASIGKRGSVGSWLYGVAFRIATRARDDAIQRRRHERRVASSPIADADSPLSGRDLRLVLDDELNHLAEKYRAPLILCDLEGKTHEQAALALGWPTGTMSRRLEKARALLRQRLIRRGVTLSVTLLAASLAETSAAVLVPPTLVSSTLKAGVVFVASRAVVAGVLSATTIHLAEGALKTMMLTKLKIAGTALLALGVAGSGTGMLAYRTSAAVKSDQRRQPKTQAVVALDTGVKPLSDAELAALRSERDASREEFDARQKEFLAGKGTLDILLEAGRILVVAELKLSTQGTDRIGLRSAHWQRMKQIENITRARYYAGRVPIEDVKLVDWNVVAAEVQLKEERNAVWSDAKGNKDALQKEIAKSVQAHSQLRDNFGLCDIGSAMHSYFVANGRYPPAAIYDHAGKPLLSWRVLLLPYFAEGEKLYQQFKLDQSWDSPHNQKLLAQMPKVYFHSEEVKAEIGATFFRVFVGAGTPFEGKHGAAEGDIPDGSERTIAVVEAAEAVPWTKPEELNYRADQPLPKLGARKDDEEFWVVLLDGSIFAVKKGFDDSLLRQVIECKDRRPRLTLDGFFKR